MVIDTSAVLAILQDEPERRAFNEAIEAADSRSLSVASLVEASIVIEVRFGAEGVRHLDRRAQLRELPERAGPERHRDLRQHPRDQQDGRG